jgi:biopolymer transport protein ExbB
MQALVDYFYLLILTIGVAHFVVLMVLWRWERGQTQGLAAYLSNLVRTLSTRADIDPRMTVHDRIDSFIADLHEVLNDRHRTDDREKLYRRLIVKDEAKPDMQGGRLETLYNFARTGIEAYPLLGILGTVLAIGLGLNAPRTAPAAPYPQAQAQVSVDQAGSAAVAPPATTGSIIRNFANSIWSTCAGIAFAIFLMMVNALIEPGFDRLAKHRRDVREVIGAAKVSLGMELSGAEAADARAERTEPVRIARAAGSSP